MQPNISRRRFIERALVTGTGLSTAILLGGCSGSSGSPEDAGAGEPDLPSQQPAQSPAQFGWKRLRLGAGGYVTGIAIARDGTKVIRTDTFGAYIWDEPAKIWRELLTRKTLPVGDVPHPVYYKQSDGGKSDGPGCWEVAIAANDSSVIYAVWNAYCYRSTDKGKTFQKTDLPRVYSRANDQNFAGGIERIMGPKMAIDPANPNIVWTSGDMGEGLWFTDNGGGTWISNSQVPHPNDGTSSKTNLGPYLVVYDPSSAIVSGRTQGIYVASYGHGLFHSNDGGTTFRAVPGAPTVFRRLTCDQLGRVWICDASTSTDAIRKYEKGAWTAYGLPNVHVVDVAVNPADPSHIVGLTNSLTFLQSKDNGNTWKYWYTHPNADSTRINTTAIDVPWLALAVNQGGVSSANAAFDPASGRCFVATGIGVFYLDSYPNDTSTKLELFSQSWGIEQLCVRSILVPPNGSVITAQLDRAAMKLPDPDKAPISYGPDLGLKNSFDLDYSISDPSYIVMLCTKAGNASAYSTDRGDTWTFFPGKDQMSKSSGGSIAVSTPGNIVHIPSNNGVAKYTLDGGISWAPLDIPGLPAVDGASGGTGWGWQWSFNRRILCADKAVPNVFYAYNYGPQGKPELAGLWRSEDGGRRWSRVKEGTIGEWTTYHAQLNSVPGQEGHLFFTAGLDQNQPFYRTQDGGSTWIEVSAWKNVISFGFGKPAPSAQYPTIFVIGWLDGTFGICRSTDNCATWTRFGDFPLDGIDACTLISGDPNVFGQCYVGFGGSGGAYFGA